MQLSSARGSWDSNQRPSDPEKIIPRIMHINVALEGLKLENLGIFPLVYSKTQYNFLPFDSTAIPL